MESTTTINKKQSNVNPVHSHVVTPGVDDETERNRTKRQTTIISKTSKRMEWNGKERVSAGLSE